MQQHLFKITDKQMKEFEFCKRYEDFLSWHYNYTPYFSDDINKALAQSYLVDKKLEKIKKKMDKLKINKQQKV